ncbi:hypothetical protein DFH08DRAFT_629597, partial [Mycena albidolilacea]
LCDLHVVAPRPYLGAQFSTAFDVYLSLQAAADQRMKATLGRDVPNWRLKNACPACLYELEGEPKLKRRFIVTQDGNNSLKRFGAKYGLSVINHLLRMLGEVTIGIDVGCKVARQVKAHPQLSVLTKENNFKGAFHGLGHSRLCSICNMAMYVDGMGLQPIK